MEGIASTLWPWILLGSPRKEGTHVCSGPRWMINKVESWSRDWAAPWHFHGSRNLTQEVTWISTVNGANWNRSWTNIIYEPLGPVSYNQFSSIKEYISQIFFLITSSLSEHYMILLEDLNSSSYSLSPKSREICLTDRKRRRVSRELAVQKHTFHSLGASIKAHSVHIEKQHNRQ